ncbi:MAG: hypothetical protein HXY50_12595 [Ignavibacteriaceae bacterium]|nr:hypothetical protein [Ignavibacteriaceae bacterium]
MKKILLLLLITHSAFIFSQEIEHRNLLELKNELKLTEIKSENEITLNQPADFKKKNAGLAMLFSLLLPGMGELYAQSYESGKYFTIAEGVLWGTYIGINSYGNWQKDRYRSFAASNGGVNLEGKDDDYFATISEYLSIEQYNNEKALERNYTDMLNENKYFWKWSSDDRRTYRSMWVSSEQAFNNLRFVVGALIINRIASVVNAVRLVAKYNKQQNEEVSWNISASVENSINLPNHLTLNFQTQF